MAACSYATLVVEVLVTRAVFELIELIAAGLEY